MNEFTQAIQSQDSLQLSLMAQSYPDKKPEPIPKQAIEIFNDLFRQLRATFPAMMATIKDQEQLNELKRQWVKAIAENQIYRTDQIEAGMRMARRHEKPFLPSPGEFISWCKTADATRYDLPEPDALYQAVMTFRGARFQYRSIDEYPWENNAQFWLVTRVSAAMTSQSLSVAETKKACKTEINALVKKLSAGFIPPEPRAQIEEHVIPTSHDVARSHIARLRAMIKASH